MALIFIVMSSDRLFVPLADFIVNILYFSLHPILYEYSKEKSFINQSSLMKSDEIIKRDFSKNYLQGTFNNKSQKEF